MAARAVHLIVTSMVMMVALSSATRTTGAPGGVNVRILLETLENTPFHKCFDAKLDWRWLRLWSSLNVEVKNNQPNQGKITLVWGANMTDLKTRMSQHNGLLPSFLPPWMQHNMKMSPLINNCVGIERTSGQVHVTIKEKFVSEIYFLLTLVGVLLYLAAPRLSRSVVFHYSTGVTVGVLASLLILVYILSRFIPRKAGAISVLVGGWALCLYLLHWVVDNFLSMQYKTYLMGYFVLAATISFAVCYWYGPVTNDRTIYLIQLFLQLLGLVSIYNGSQHEGSTVAIIVVLFLISWLPCRPVRHIAFLLRWRRGPAKIRLLTEDEYNEQGRIETKKALDSLREYCRSPQCDQWKMIANLESPKRFARFVVGEEDHVSTLELSTYEEDLSLLTLDDSSSSDSFSSDSQMETE